MALNRIVGSVERGPMLGMGSVIPGGQGNRWALGSMVGRSSAMERLFLQMRYLAGHLRLGLLEGERGTGKRMAAETLHGLAPHRGGSFVHVSARDFFVGGQFSAKLGEARGGTLYLSGVDGLNPEAQGRLLHLLGWIAGSRMRRTALHGPDLHLEEAEKQPRALLVSSERPLRSLVLHGQFRSDLQQQLTAVHLQLPPLRERREDIPLLLQRFLERAARDRGTTVRSTAPDLVPALLAYHWPGNVREFEAVIAQGLERSQGGFLRRADLMLNGPELPAPQVWVARAGMGPRLAAAMPPPAAMRPRVEPHRSSSRPSMEGMPGARFSPFSQGQVDGSDTEPALDANLDRAIMRHIRRVLAGVSGNKLRAARLLGISRSTLYRLLDADGERAGQALAHEEDARESRETAEKVLG